MYVYVYVYVSEVGVSVECRSVTELLSRGYDAARAEQATHAVSRETGPAGRLGFAVADLTADAGWREAMEGVDAVLHVASPLGASSDAKADQVTPARAGTLRVMRAATGAGGGRVVRTSAVNAASPSSYSDDSVTDETLWTDPDDPHAQPLPPVRDLRGAGGLGLHGSSRREHAQLATVLPGAVFGPVLTPAATGWVGFIGRLAGKAP
ncbi:NAD-dependent epimerase/dehydratase family protein [Streptomyces sp. NPDC099050]|uniref:NAD-dependent epimerase/dehydratase family protein n=1 Tax=Streptomyces sp. NPDC099050 TaxID=3366100 RepID=UPI003809F8BC